jgi:3-oxoacyl-[acyl-carrier protein] reductase
LISEDVNVVITETADLLRALNPEVTVIAVAGDISTPAGRSATLAAHEHFDILINNAVGHPPGESRNPSPSD